MRQEGCITDDEEAYLYAVTTRTVAETEHKANKQTKQPPAEAEEVQHNRKRSASELSPCSDFECPICLDLLVNPVVGESPASKATNHRKRNFETRRCAGSCGHDFCQHCLERWVEQKRGAVKCPICRKALSQEVPGVCRRIASQIEALFPEEWAKRKKEVDVELDERSRKRAFETERLGGDSRARDFRFTAEGVGSRLGSATRRLEAYLATLRRFLDQAPDVVRGSRPAAAHPGPALQTRAFSPSYAHYSGRSVPLTEATWPASLTQALGPAVFGGLVTQRHRVDAPGAVFGAAGRHSIIPASHLFSMPPPPNSMQPAMLAVNEPQGERALEPLGPRQADLLPVPWPYSVPPQPVPDFNWLDPSLPVTSTGAGGGDPRLFQNAASAEAWGTAAEGPPHLATALAQGESVVEQFSEGSGLELLDDYRSNFGQISGMLPDLPPPGQMRFTMGAYQPLRPSRRLRARRPSIFQRPPNPRRDNRFRGSTGM